MKFGSFERFWKKWDWEFGFINRLRTLFAFIMPKSLKNYNPEKDDFRICRSHNRELANKSFEDLDRDTKQRILYYRFSVNVLTVGAEDRDIYQIFARMNSTV